ncbi:MAG TPA: PilZ domain-containing protein [Nitrospirota bacterium]|nr:PilZ domain-containing protein [Nitrospirota bacterium]
MKKILISDTFKSLFEKEKNFMMRSDVKLYTAASNDELLSVHRTEKVNLIIASLDAPGVRPEDLFLEIRKVEELRRVSLIMISHDKPADKARAERCSPNVLLTFPVDVRLLLEKSRNLLNIPARESYRVLLSVNINGRSKDQAFFCRSENISTTGLLLETDRAIQEGDRLTCSFFLPESQQINVPGEVVRKIVQDDKSGAKRYGVRFEKMNIETRNAIESFIQKKSQKFR